MAWEGIPAPSYPTSPGYYPVGNALGNLFANYQQAEIGEQQKQANALRLQDQQMRLNAARAFAGGVPMNADGTPDYSRIAQTLAQSGDINAIGALAPIIMEQRNIEGANAPDPFFGGGGGASGGGTATGAGGSRGGGSGGGFEGSLAQIESADSDVYSRVDKDYPGQPNSRSQGYFQIDTPTWRDFAARAGVDVAQYPQAKGTPREIQWQVAQTIPLSRFGKRTRDMLESQYGFGKDAENLTVGELASRFGGGGGGRGAPMVLGGASVAALGGGASERPAVPPASASAGSTIPRADTPANWEAQANALPVPIVSGSPAPATAPAPANPGFMGAAAAELPATVASRGQPPVQIASPGPAPLQRLGSVATMVLGAGLDPARSQQAASLISRRLGVDPASPLNPAQAASAQRILQNFRGPGAQPRAAPGQTAGQTGPGPVLPQFPLPRGFTDPQQAILAIDQDIARLSRFGPAASGRIRALEDMRSRIAASSAPLEVHPGQMIVDPRDGRTLLQAPYANAGTMALQAFLAEHPDATAEQIQQFIQAGRGVRSGVGMYMQRFLQEHPDATAQDVARAAQDFQSGGSALTKFTSGVQGNAVRSFNVLVDHLGTLQSAADALKNGNTRVFNQIGQEIARQTGVAAPTNFDATKAIVGDEIVKAVLGGGAALGDREEIKAAVDRASSPAQLSGVIEQYKKLALGQLRGLRRQYSEATGRDDFDRFLAPGTRQFFGDEGAQQGQTTGGSQNSGLPPGWSVEVH